MQLSNIRPEGEYKGMQINIHKCESCEAQVVYSMYDSKFKHAEKTDCKGGKVVLKYQITK